MNLSSEPQSLGSLRSRRGDVVAAHDDGRLTPEQFTRFAEQYDRLRPATAGIFAGAAAGVLMLATADRFVHVRPNSYDLVSFVGRLVSNGALNGIEAQAAGFGAALGVGAISGALFGILTRHLRKLAPLFLFSVVFFPAIWTVLQAFVFPVAAPWLGTALPYVPMLAGSAAFGVVVALQLPLRKGSPPRAW